MSLPYNPALKERAKALRKAGNLAEVLFWQQVRNKQFRALDFDRQKIIGNYIVDFYNANYQVVIEIDGNSHDEKQDYDSKRQDYLERLGLKVIRYTDREVKRDIDSVMRHLDECFEEYEKTAENEVKQSGFHESEVNRSGFHENEMEYPAFHEKQIDHPAFQAPLQRRGTLGYKSSGGAMVYNEELEKEIPEGWEVGTLGNICEFIDGDRGSNYPNGSDFIENGFCLFLNAGNVTKKGFDFSSCSFISKEKDNLLRKGKLKRQDIVITSRGTVGNIAFYTEFIEFENIRINSGMLILRPLIKPSFIYTLLKSYEFNKLIENYISGSAVPQLPIKDLSIIKILKSSENIMNNFSSQVEYIYGLIDTIKNQNQKLTQLQSLLLSRLATLEG